MSTLIANCGSCGGSGELRVGGATPYVRCLAADPPQDRKWKLGALRFESTERALTIAGLPQEVRIAVFAGPSLAGPLTKRAVAALAAQKPHLSVLIGGFGDNARAAKGTLAVLGAADFPTLVLSGGRDNAGDLQAALASLSGSAAARVIPIDSLRTIRLLQASSDAPDSTQVVHVLLPIAGSADGRYARTDDSCGFSLADLQAASGVVGSPEVAERRWLLSWNAPGRGGAFAIARGPEGLDLGSDALAEFASRVGAAGGLHAWPRVRQAGAVAGAGTRSMGVGEAAVDAQLLVPSLGGSPIEESSGGFMNPGFAIVTLGPAGMRLVELLSARPTGGPARVSVPN